MTLTPYPHLIERARSGQRILIDGGTGSEVIRRGVSRMPNGWGGGAALSHPNIVRQIHADYLALGVDMIASNTFATGRNVLEDAGFAADFVALNRRSVELAVEARQAAGPAAAHVAVAAGVSNWSFSGSHPSLERLHENTVAQVEIMRDAGADFISLEMMVDIPRMATTIDAVATVGLPIWVGLTVGPEEGHEVDELGDVVQLRDGDSVADAVDVAKQCDLVDAFCLMHTDVRLTQRGLEAIRSRWDGPLGAYAHAAQEKNDELSFDDVISPAEYAAYEPAWRSAGATMIGGCCGIGPDHVHLLSGQQQP